MEKNGFNEDLLVEQNQVFSMEVNNLEHKNQATDKPLKVLFVSSGNSKNFDLAPFIKAQGDSLATIGVQVTYFKIQGKGIFGYLKNVGNLRAFIKKNNFDLIHAHFTLSAVVAVLTFSGLPVVLSLMGTDAFGRINKLSKIPFSNKSLTLLTYLIQPFVSIIISKSPNIEQYVWQKKKSWILPNGVDFEKFKGDRKDFRKELGMDPEKKYVLFLGNKEDPNKNFGCLLNAKEELYRMGFEILSPYPICNGTVSKYLSSADMLVMCSWREGSPNVVKEAMASNCKGVFTDVGDVQHLVKETEGYAIFKGDTVELVRSIIQVSSMKSCTGRKRLETLGLDVTNVAKKLKDIYLSLL